MATEPVDVEAEARGYQRAIDVLLTVPSHETHVAADWLEARRDGREPTFAHTDCAAEKERLGRLLVEARSVADQAMRAGDRSTTVAAWVQLDEAIAQRDEAREEVAALREERNAMLAIQLHLGDLRETAKPIRDRLVESVERMEWVKFDDEELAFILAMDALDADTVRPPCPHCGPGYRYGDDGCRHAPPEREGCCRAAVESEGFAHDHADWYREVARLRNAIKHAVQLYVHSGNTETAVAGLRTVLEGRT